MIRYKLKQLIAEKEFRERRRITALEVADATGISRATLSKMMNQHGANVEVENLDKLCGYFRCELSGLAEFVDPKSSPAAAGKPAAEDWTQDGHNVDTARRPRKKARR